MSVPDYDEKHRIYQHAKDVCNLHGFQYFFTLDDGHHRTAIIFNIETGEWRLPMAFEGYDTINYPEIWKEPDLAVMRAQPPIAIEYEEETGDRRTGARQARRGHHHKGDAPTKRDASKYECYRAARIPFLRIWESELNGPMEVWKMMVTEFLFECWRNDHRTPENLKALADLEDY